MRVKYGQLNNLIYKQKILGKNQNQQSKQIIVIQGQLASICYIVEVVRIKKRWIFYCN